MIDETDQQSAYRYATAPTGDHPDYEARTDGAGTALLVAHRDDSARPSGVEWQRHQWAQEQTSDWSDTTI